MNDEQIKELTKRVEQLEKNSQPSAPELTDEQLNRIINAIHEAAKESSSEYGLPLYEPHWMVYARQQIRKALRGLLT